ncbi:tyrosine-type recombinase/integrase [Megalodesulfovibrio gigas]|uniref:tyrosine-type recombinase/integrase n=1 Tax=Megalodesulfovibrio gigas TaxID=879 RepID=UPI0004805A01|nr:integrase arm-type DNA-binding domain-containing protein [Megalodesulfovibrio gigas]
MTTKAKKPLTDKEIRAAKPGEKVKRLPDGTVRGLYLEIRPAGGKSWVLRWEKSGKANSIGIGPYPDRTLADARALALEHRRLLLDGLDPAGEKRKEREAARHEAELERATFGAVAGEWFTGMEPTWSPRHAATVRQRLDHYLLPPLGSLPIAEVTPPVLLDALQPMVKAGHLDTAAKTKIIAGQVLRFAMARGLTAFDAAASLRGALPAKSRAHHHAHMTHPKEIGGLMRAIYAYGGDFVTIVALRLMPLLLLRPGELRSLLWREVDLDAAELRLDHAPAELDARKDGRKLHKCLIVPLPTQAVELLRSLQPLTGHCKFVFPSARTRHGGKCERPMSENALAAALAAMGYAGRQTPHGFRHMASTWMNEQGWPADAIERQLSHEPRDAVRGTYNLSQLLPVRRQMLQAWADYLDALRDEKPA